MNDNKRVPFWLYSEVINKILITIENFDDYTKKHCERVGIYTALFLRYLQETNKWTDEFKNLSEIDLKDIVYAAFVHDVGKVAVHANVIKQERKLSKEDWLEVKDHPMNGAFFFMGPGYEHIRDYILMHHERWDGGGYSSGLAGKEISLGGRILTIIDSFDAMTDKRPYATRPPMELEEALEEIKKCAGIQFDPELAQLFVDFCQNMNYNILKIKDSEKRIDYLAEVFNNWINQEGNNFKIELTIEEDGERILIKH